MYNYENTFERFGCGFSGIENLCVRYKNTSFEKIEGDKGPKFRVTFVNRAYCPIDPEGLSDNERGFECSQRKLVYEFKKIGEGHKVIEEETFSKGILDEEAENFIYGDGAEDGWSCFKLEKCEQKSKIWSDGIFEGVDIDAKIESAPKRRKGGDLFVYRPKYNFAKIPSIVRKKVDKVLLDNDLPYESSVKDYMGYTESFSHTVRGWSDYYCFFRISGFFVQAHVSNEEVDGKDIAKIVSFSIAEEEPEYFENMRRLFAFREVFDSLHDEWGSGDYWQPLPPVAAAAEYLLMEIEMYLREDYFCEFDESEERESGTIFVPASIDEIFPKVGCHHYSDAEGFYDGDFSEFFELAEAMYAATVEEKIERR